MFCSICDKLFDMKDKVTASSCGHLVHYFKLNCIDSDYCSLCQKDIQIFANGPFVKLNIKDNNSMIANTDKMGTNQGTIQTGNEQRKLDDDFIKQQFEIQREITNHLINKLKFTDNIVTVVKEQEIEMQKILVVVKQLKEEINVLKQRTT